MSALDAMQAKFDAAQPKRPMTDADALDTFRWGDRPFQNMTDGELERAIAEREAALGRQQPGSIIHAQVRLALDRLEAERTGRLRHKVQIWRDE